MTGGGDYTGPGALSLVSDGAQATDFFEQLRPSFETFGNHDFDYGIDNTKEIVAASPQQWLCCNVFDETGALFGRDVGVKKTAVRTRGELSIGFYGLSHPDTGSMQPGASRLTFKDSVEPARQAIRDLRDEGADVIVALSHCGAKDEVVTRNTETDLILGGHEHDGVMKRVDGTVIARSMGRGRDVVEVTVSEEHITTNHHSISTTEADEAVTESFQSLLDRYGLAETVDHVEESIERPTTDGLGNRVPVLGDFLTDAFQWAGDTDLAICTSGAL